MPALVSTLGRFKADVAAERLHDVNHAAKLDVRTVRYTPENSSTFDLSGFDCVVDAIDSVLCKAHLIRSAEAAGVPVFSSMGAASRIDPSRIRATPFKKVEGDGLARALRRRFKEEGWPVRDFMCVWSNEPSANLGERMDGDGRANGSLMPVTASFGLRLASLVLDFIRGGGARLSRGDGMEGGHGQA